MEQRWRICGKLIRFVADLWWRRDDEGGATKWSSDGGAERRWRYPRQSSPFGPWCAASSPSGLWAPSVRLASSPASPPHAAPSASRSLTKSVTSSASASSAETTDVFENDNSLSMVMELCEPFTLYDKIVQRTFSDDEAALLMKQPLEALSHCHMLGIVHQDVKPDNLLFDRRNNLKVADFGSAVWLPKERCVGGVVGTPYYVAPEVLMGREYNEKVDVWSAGVILYVMLARVPPFYDESTVEIFEEVLRGNLRFPTRIFSTVLPAAKDLLRKAGPEIWIWG
ncbi:hypothetical protein FH972_020136 [Carpinus fangiana]|uniref:Protein kinase domain-containing protein n=1 Tax=Carpinus fangiana TaxID=176857 RepID=A0A5N6RSS8_9ROSI|nr:hypothetical protein FH972_020136 [Carpinus fangiana]